MLHQFSMGKFARIQAVQRQSETLASPRKKETVHCQDNGGNCNDVVNASEDIKKAVGRETECTDWKDDLGE